MAATRPPLSYRQFQEVWNFAIEPMAKRCSRCQKARVRCDGEQPCQRCLGHCAECVYRENEKSSPTMSDVEVEIEEDRMEIMLLDDLSVLGQKLDKLDFDIVRLKQQRTGAAKQQAVKRPEIALEDTNKKADNPSWLIIVTKRGIRLNIGNTCHLYDLLAHIAGTSTVYRRPTLHPRIGTHAMMCRLTQQYPRLHSMHTEAFPKYLLNFAPQLRPEASALVITPYIEKRWLDLVLIQTNICPTWYLKKIDIYERLGGYTHSQRPQSHYSMAFFYAVGALNAEHMLLHHSDTTTLDLPSDLDKSNFGRRLSKTFFNRARELLIEQFLEHEPDELSADLLNTLLAMTKYSIVELQYSLASSYLSMALRVAIQLNYHRALRDSHQNIVDVSELRNAIMWNILVTLDHAHTLFSKLPPYTDLDDARISLLGTIVNAPPDMPYDELQRLHATFHTARHSAICRDYLDALWTEAASEPDPHDLDRFADAFAYWSANLPPDLQLAGLTTPRRSRASFHSAIHLQLYHHVSLLDLYHQFLPSVHHDPASLPPGFLHRAERTYSDIAITGTRLALTYVHVAECGFPLEMYSIVSNGHMRLAAEAVDGEIKELHRAYVAMARKIMMKVKDYKRGDLLFRAYVRYFEEFMERERIDLDADTILSKDNWFEPVWILGTDQRG